MKTNKKNNASEKKKGGIIFKWTVFGLSCLLTLFVIFARLIPAIANTDIYKSLDIFVASSSHNPWLRSISYIICILFISSAIRKFLSLSMTVFTNLKSVISLLCSFLKYIAIIVLIFFILATFGVDTTAIVAGIGILSLIVGLAIQPLLQDIIAGMFIVFEKTYNVDDVIVVDGFRGTVTEIGIRATKIKDAGGDIKVVNNSDIRTLINMTGDLSLAISDIDIEYSESLERVETVLADNLDKIKEKIPTIIDGPYYKGVAKLGASGVTLRIIAQCKEDSKFQTQRDLNRQLKLLFDANDINIPFTQVVVHKPSSSTVKTSSHKTDDFVLKQNQLSANIEDDDSDK